MGRTVKWLVAGLVTAVAFGVTTAVLGALVLPVVMASAADRWVVAGSAGVAVAAVAGLWGQSWATRDSADESAEGAGGPGPGAGPSAAGGERSVSAGRDITGIASTGDGATNIQGR